MLLPLLMTLFGLIALFEGIFLLTHIHKPFLVFDPTKSKYLAPQLKNWGIVMTIVGILSFWMDKQYWIPSYYDNHWLCKRNINGLRNYC